MLHSPSLPFAPLRSPSPPSLPFAPFTPLHSQNTINTHALWKHFICHLTFIEVTSMSKWFRERRGVKCFAPLHSPSLPFAPSLPSLPFTPFAPLRPPSLLFTPFAPLAPLCYLTPCLHTEVVGTLKPSIEYASLHSPLPPHPLSPQRWWGP